MSNPRYIYREDGGSWLVALLSDTTDEDDMRTVELECLAELRPSPIFGSIRIGGRWTARCKVGFESMIGWDLHPYSAASALN